MNTTPSTSSGENRPNLVSGILARAATVVFFFALEAVLLLLGSGQIRWIWAWTFVGVGIVIMTINSVVLLRTSPETIAERGKPKETQPWDRAVSGLLAVAQYLLLPLIAGLDLRFAWTGELSLAWHLAGLLGLVLGYSLTSWAMIVNAYFSTAVRIQSDRGQTVCRSGPYGWVRHPGYVGFILQCLATPLLLGSFWAVLPGVLAAATMVVRTSLEDRLLRSELAGYSEYAVEVSYRLLPGIW
jgi:protein-S-isoprenylcysteine O-methyltransferase Ste14